jgi:hypothetical protein
VLVAGVTLLTAEMDVSAVVAGAVFLVGAASAVVSILANQTQHSYYKNARDRKRYLENRLGLDDLALTTTPGMGGARERLASVTRFQNFILGALLAADLTGLGVAVERAFSSKPDPRVQVAAQVQAKSRHASRKVPLVVTRKGRIEASAMPRPRELVMLRLRPGRYQVSVFAGKLCTSRASITSAPLQRLVIRCR